MEIPTPLFSALVLSLYLKLEKGLSFAFFFDPYLPVTFERLQTLLSPDVVLLFFLCLLFFEHLSSFILLHVYLRLKLRKVRRLLKALTDRVMHSPEKKA